jgi:phosphatidate cytidylyltransferase
VSNLKLRLISAAAMIVIVYGLMVASTYSRWAVIAAILAIAAWEFSRMLNLKYQGPAVAWVAGALVFAFAIPHFPGLTDNATGIVATPAAWAWALSILSVLGFTLLGFRYLDIEGMAPWIYLQIFGCAYFGLYASALFGLLQPVPGWRGIFPLLMIQIAIACADSGAYFTGRKLGKRKLAPTISSGKTVEGAYGGIALTVLATALLGPKLLHTGLLANLGLGLVIALTSIMGDLFISILKRYTGMKDSSHLIPGHGGILDRFDSFIFSAPVALFYLQIVTA